MHPYTGAAVVNGVELPQRVAEEIRRLGIALSWYSAGELEDAVEACAFDGQLIDDPFGDDFRDKLTLTHQERLQIERKQQDSPSFFADEEADEEEKSRKWRWPPLFLLPFSH